MARHLIAHHHGGHHNVELVDSIPVPRRSSHDTRRIIMQLRLDGLCVGDILDCRFEAQFTNDVRDDRGQKTNVMCVTLLLLTPDAASVAEGVEVTEANGRNVTPNMHHDHHVKVQAFEVTRETAGTQYLNVIAYAASDAAPADGSGVLKVDRDYGRIGVLHFR